MFSVLTWRTELALASRRAGRWAIGLMIGISLSSKGPRCRAMLRLYDYQPIPCPSRVKIGELQRSTQAARARLELCNVVSQVASTFLRADQPPSPCVSEQCCACCGSPALSLVWPSGRRHKHKHRAVQACARRPLAEPPKREAAICFPSIRR